MRTHLTAVLARGLDPWRWPSGSQPLGTRMLMPTACCAGRYIAQGHVTKNQPITVPIFCNGEVSLELPEVFSDLLQYGARVGVLEDANKGCCCRRSNYLFRFVQSVASNEH